MKRKLRQEILNMNTGSLISTHTHLGDIFHENKNIAFKRPGIVPHGDG